MRGVLRTSCGDVALRGMTIPVTGYERHVFDGSRSFRSDDDIVLSTGTGRHRLDRSDIKAAVEVRSARTGCRDGSNMGESKDA